MTFKIRTIFLVDKVPACPLFRGQHVLYAEVWLVGSILSSKKVSSNQTMPNNAMVKKIRLRLKAMAKKIRVRIIMLL